MPLCVVYTCSYLASRPSRGSAAGQTRRIRRRRASDTLQTATYRRTIHVRTVFSSDGGARPIARPSVRAVAVQMQNKRGHYDCSNDDSGQHCCRCCSCCCAESNLRRNDTPRHGTALRDALLCIHAVAAKICRMRIGHGIILCNFMGYPVSTSCTASCSLDVQDVYCY